MSSTSTIDIQPSYLIRGNAPACPDADCAFPVRSHRLGEFSAFADEGLVDLLDRHPRNLVFVETMGSNPAHPSEYQNGDIGPYHGRQIVEMLRRGRIVIRIQSSGSRDSWIQTIADRLISEWSDCDGQTRPHELSCELVLASPTTIGYYGLTAHRTAIWNIRGKQRIRFYPSTKYFVDSAVIAAVIANKRPVCYYEPAFDDASEIFELTAGQMITWPQHTPYRIENGDDVVVSLVTHYRTQSSDRRNLTRRWGQMFCLRRRIESFGLQRIEKTFQLDSTAPDCVLQNAPAESSSATPLEIAPPVVLHLAGENQTISNATILEN